MGDEVGRRKELEALGKGDLVDQVLRLEAALRAGSLPDGSAPGPVVDAAAVGVADAPELLRAIIDAAPVGITVKGRDGRYVYANAVSAAWFGRRPVDMLGRIAGDLLPPSIVRRVSANDARVFESGTAIPFYEDVLIVDGEERLMRTTKVPLHQPDGTLAWVLTVSVDVTETRENEARLLTLAETAPFPIYFKDRDARFTLANDRCLELYGVGLADVLGRTSAEVYGDARGKEYLAEDRYVLDERRVFQREIELGGVPHFVVKFPVIDPHGRLLGLGGIEQDISRLKDMQIALIRAKETAELASRSKTEFLANMSHELRTPLNSVIGFADLIRHGKIPDPTGKRAMEYAHDIVRSGEHLLQLIGDILDVSRIEIGTLPVEERDLDLARLIAEGVRMLKVRAPNDVEIHAELHAAELPVRADARRLRQILINLLSNAVKFTPRGEVRITTAAAADGGLTIAVEDTGIGIPENDLVRVLAPFSRSGSAAIRSREGAGLGLWLAKELTELHGGRLDLESREGKGTRVTVSLPPERVL